ncbi:MAG: hypothetical protein BroJett025_07350 [Patescibacteria group bacterium]|nr:MAG: hypothetical protein BroJett025_07350 [Patescibacteria group bacterium]
MGIEKKHGLPVKEAATLTGVLALLYYISLFSFNAAQVESIRNRDRSRCQYPGCKNRTKYKVEVHHVIPQGYAFRVKNMRPDTPFNAVCLCEEHHVGYPKDGREHQVGLAFDPVHPDTYFVHLILVGKFDLLPRWLIEKVNKDFPGLYDYYKKVRDDKLAKGMSFDDMYSGVMRTWRSNQLDQHKIYWNAENDPFLQVAAINSTITAIRRGWRFPLRMLGGNVKAENRGMYAWDNLVALSIEKYVLGLSKRDLNDIFREMKLPGSESRIVFYYKIYVPAIQHFENRDDMAGMISNYLNLLPAAESKALIKAFDKARNSDESYKILFDKFYSPALSNHNSRNNKQAATTWPSGLRSGLRNRVSNARAVSPVLATSGSSVPSTSSTGGLKRRL